MERRVGQNAAMLDPIGHAETTTGRRQSALVDLWTKVGFAAALSEVTGPHVYRYGALSVPTVAVTLYEVRRHVLIEDGRVRRDASVPANRFRIGQPGRQVVVDAVPAVASGDLLLMYFGDRLLREVGTAYGLAGPIALADRVWDVDDPFLALSARRLFEAVGPGHGLLAEQLALTLAFHVADRYGTPDPARLEPPGALRKGTLERVVAFIRSDPAAAITLSDLAGLAGLSPSQFLRAFKRSTGTTPHRFLLSERVAIAEDMLTHSELPLAEIAVACGFSSQSHLGTAFRAATGVTPAGYRRLRGRRG